MNLKIQLILIFNFILLSSFVHTQKIQDFTYADVIEPEQQKKDDKIYIFPQSSIFNQFQFPQACNIGQLLDVKLTSKQQQPQISDIDGEISFLKNRTSQFLRLSSKIELLVQNLKELPKLQHNQYFTVSEEELKVIEEQEKRLKQINNQIDAKGIQLEKIVNQMMKQQQNPLFKQAALSFQRKALEQKIVLFNNILDQTKNKQQQVDSAASQQQLNNYFISLQNIFNTENNLIQTVDTLLQNHNQLALIKARVTSLSTQLKAYDLTIAQKQQCQNQFLRIKQKQKHDKQVIHLIETLKLRKLQFNQANKYCEGVVIKLIQRVKRLLAGYDYIWNCKQGLQETIAKRQQTAKQLQQAQRKLDQLQMSKSVQAFRQQFEHNRGLVQKKINQMNSLKLDDYYRDPNMIENIISLSQERIAQIDNQLAYLPIKSNQDLASLQNMIKQKIEDIKKLKTTYCQQNQDYVINSKIIEDKLYKLEQQQSHNSWISGMQLQKIKEIQLAKFKMGLIQLQIEDYLKRGTV